MKDVSIIRSVLQQSPCWAELTQEEQVSLVDEGLFVNETLESSPLWETYSDSDQERVFLEAWLSYSTASNLIWMAVN